MPRPESRSGRSERNNEHVRRSVRVFAVTPIPVSELAGALSVGIPIDQLSLVKVVLARKNETQLVTALGGRLLPGEDLLHASGRKVFEESLLTRESQQKLKKSVGSGRPIPYVRADTGQKCEAFLTVMPVRSATVSLHEPRESKDAPKSVYKITELVHVTPKELGQLFTDGRVVTARGEEFRMFGHLTQTQVSDVVLTKDARQVQNKEFSRVLYDISSYEYELKQVMVNEINRTRHLHHKPQIASLGECGQEELVRGYILAKWHMGMADNRMRESDNRVLPTLATDLVTSALYLREYPPEALADALMAAPTREVRRARNAIFHALQKTVGDLYELMGEDIQKGYEMGTNTPKPMDVVSALRYIWPDVLEQSPETVTTLLELLDEAFVVELGTHLKTSYTVVRRALALVPEIPPYLANELRGVKKNTFQEYYPSNEVASAMERPFFQMLYVLGLNPYKNITGYHENEAMKRDRGEILMQIAIQLTAIPAVEQQLEANNSLFEIALASFMQYPPEIDQLKLKRTPHTVYRRETEIPVDGEPLQLWHDKRLVKSIVRLWFKGLQEPLIRDVFSDNFVIRDTNFSEEERHNLTLRFGKATAFREALLLHCQKVLHADGWTVSIEPGTHKTSVIDTARKIIFVGSGKERKKLIAATQYKRRSGSIANTIIREKFVLLMEKNGVKRRTEVSIYPIERVDGDRSPLSDSGLIGFVEKLLDDMSGNYNGYRLIKTDDDDPTAPSVLEQVRPPAWQRSAFDDIWALQHSPNKKRKR